MMMRDHVLAATRLSDAGLLARLRDLAGRERAALVELLAHLAELAGRRYGTLFAYCRGALGFSEDAAYNRVEAGRACRRFPVILELLVDGSVTLTSVRMLGRHLTPANHAEVLAAARGRSKPEIEALVARLAPKPDLPPMIRRLPDPARAPADPAPPPPAISAAIPCLSVPAPAPEG
jgi:hypothetical protein